MFRAGADDRIDHVVGAACQRWTFFESGANQASRPGKESRHIHHREACGRKSRRRGARSRGAECHPRPSLRRPARSPAILVISIVFDRLAEELFLIIGLKLPSTVWWLSDSFAICIYLLRPRSTRSNKKSHQRGPATVSPLRTDQGDPPIAGPGWLLDDSIVIDHTQQSRGSSTKIVTVE